MVSFTALVNQRLAVEARMAAVIPRLFTSSGAVEPDVEPISRQVEPEHRSILEAAQLATRLEAIADRLEEGGPDDDTELIPALTRTRRARHVEPAVEQPDDQAA